MASSAGSVDVDPRIGSLAAGKYRILRLLGRGGMGTVYEAQNVAIGKRVALKFVLVDAGAGNAALARFHREARAVSAIESAHIVQVFDTGETDAGEPFLVMELLQGEDLGARLKRAGKLDPLEAATLVAQALRGLRRAHAAGIVHRDLKPENLFLVDDEELGTHLKIVDFGLSKMRPPAPGTADADSPAMVSITQQGTALGTPLYMSPEQVEALTTVDHRTDLWSMGAILYEALCGAPPFVEPSYARLVMAICQRDAKDVRELSPSVPEELAAVVARALERDRERRFQSADELLRALGEAVPEAYRGPAAASSTPGSARASRPQPPPSAPATPRPVDARPVEPARVSESGQSPQQPPGAELRTYTAGAATLWLSQSPALALWRGEVAAPDRLRIEAQGGTVHELRLTPMGPLKLGRTARVGDEVNDLVYPDVASRLATTLRHDGVRWWMKRRQECSVPVQIGARSLNRGEEAPLVHGTLVAVGGMRATLVDRRYVSPTVPAGAVDPLTGLLGRVGLEQETASFLQRQRPGALILVRSSHPAGAAASEHDLLTPAAVALHATWPSLAIGHLEPPSSSAAPSRAGTVVILFPGSADDVAAACSKALEVARGAGLDPVACGYWSLTGGAIDAGREIELSLHAIRMVSAPGAVALRELSKGVSFASADDVLTASRDAKRTTLLFAIEEQNALGAVGPHVVTALEQELSALVAGHAAQGSLVARLSEGVVAACISRKTDPAVIAAAVQCEWHSRPPVLDGKVELPRTLSWEILHGGDAVRRATELSRECSDPHGVLSALSGGLPYPIAGRVHAAIAASSAVERVKMLFDVLEGTWRFIAMVLVSAFFAKRTAPGEAPAGFEQMMEFNKRVGSRDGLSLGSFRELARIAARGFGDRDDPVGALARDVLNVKVSDNQTFDTLSNLMHAERNSFAHGHYNEARAAADLPEFEQMTRTFLRALRPLCAWTLVTVEKTEPDLYGDVQTVEFVDHTGPFNTGTRRRIGLNSPVRLANVVYLARFREGLVLPLEPLLRRVASEDRYDLYWMDHLPRAGTCTMSSVAGGSSIKAACDVRKLPPLMRTLLG